MRSAQRSVRAHRQPPQRATRQVAARHRSADLPGQADGSHKPRAAYAAHCTEKKSERQQAHPSAPSAPPAPPAAPAAPRRSKAPATPLRHRSTRTLNPLADVPPHHARPISITRTTQVTAPLAAPLCYRGVPLARIFISSTDPGTTS